MSCVVCVCVRGELGGHMVAGGDESGRAVRKTWAGGVRQSAAFEYCRKFEINGVSGF